MAYQQLLGHFTIAQSENLVYSQECTAFIVLHNKV